MAELIHEYAEPLAARDGVFYVVRLYGEPRLDGTWQGDLEFLASDGRPIRRVPRVTTQRHRDALARWATGLGPDELAAAFARAYPSDDVVGARARGWF